MNLKPKRVIEAGEPAFEEGDTIQLRNGRQRGVIGTVIARSQRNKGSWQYPIYYWAYLVDRGNGTGWYRESGMEYISISEADIDHAQVNLVKILAELS